MGADPERDVVVFGREHNRRGQLVARVAGRSSRARWCSRRCSSTTPTTSRGGLGPPGRHVGARPDGTLDEDDLDRLLARHAGRIALLTVTGRLQRHRDRAAGARPGRRGCTRPAGASWSTRPSSPPTARSTWAPTTTRGHLDFVALSAHKMYAPFGTGALIGRPTAFDSRPHQPGGGTVRAVTIDDVAVGRPARPGGGAAPPTSSAQSPSPPPWRTAGRGRARPHRRPRAASSPPTRVDRLAAVPGAHPPRPARRRHGGDEGGCRAVHRRRHRLRRGGGGARLRARRSGCAADNPRRRGRRADQAGSAPAVGGGDRGSLQPDVFLRDGTVAPSRDGHHPATVVELADHARPLS